MRDVKDIVAEFLEAHGYDGLFDADNDCACSLDDLFPCGEGSLIYCQPGYKIPCNCGDHDFHIGREKPQEGEISICSTD